MDNVNSPSINQSSSLLKYFLVGFFESIVILILPIFIVGFKTSSDEELFTKTIFGFLFIFLPSIFFTIRLKYFERTYLTKKELITLYTGIIVASTIVIGVYIFYLFVIALSQGGSNH